MGTTVGGLPWPENSDPLAAGAGAIRSLAEAIDPAFFWAERLAAFSVGGGGSDVSVGGGSAAWETVEANFAITGPAGGFTVPKAGIWRVNAAATIAIAVGTRICVAVNFSGGKSIGGQGVPGAAAGTNQVYMASGVIRVGAGETVQMSVSQNSGSSANFGGAGTRFATRFSAQWIAK